MEAETFKAYTLLVRLMKEKYHIDLDSHSAWRSIATQEKVYEDLTKKFGEEWTKTHVAIPGTSEHHTGLAFDLRFKSSFVPKILRNKANFLAKKTGIQKKIFEIIEKEALQFGLIKRYDESKEAITGVKGEAWHFRYVGVEHAKEMHQRDMCLEEYVKFFKLKKQNTEAAKTR